MKLLPCNRVASLYTLIEITTNSDLLFRPPRELMRQPVLVFYCIKRIFETIADYLKSLKTNQVGRGRPKPGGGYKGAVVKRQGIKIELRPWQRDHINGSKCFVIFFQRHATQMTLLPCNSVASLYTWIEGTTNSQLFFTAMKRSIVKESLH